MELELELILTKILELELELNPKNVAGIGIGINSIFFGMTNGLHIHIYVTDIYHSLSYYVFAYAIIYHSCFLPHAYMRIQSLPCIEMIKRMRR